MEHTLLSPWQMVVNADLVVKAVVAIIAMLSLWSWYTIFKLWVGARAAHASSMQPTGVFKAVWAAPDDFKQSEGLLDSQLRDVLLAAMKRRAQEVLEGYQAGLPMLAVVSSVAPFIGLFGTVWGIMNSFIGIAASKDTSLAVVAPGIAEALVVTALGLVAAIPASFAYNRFAATFSNLNRRLLRAIEDHVDGLAAPSLPAGRTHQ
jgi:biopolymer transport protein ExbB/TolQ